MIDEPTPKKVRVSTLRDFKSSGRKITCLTSYDHLTAGIFDAAGIDVLLVGDSAADNALGYQNTLPITVDEMIPFGRAVATAAKRALVVIDMPFGSYETGISAALDNAIRLMKVTGAAAVKLEGGRKRVPQIKALIEAGIPVMGHLGFTPQSVNALGGFKIQGRGDSSAELREDAIALAEAGVFAIVFEMVPADLATAISKDIDVPTIGIGAGAGTDGQILVWTDFAGLTGKKPRTFVKQFTNLHGALTDATKQYIGEVQGLTFPSKDNSFSS